MLAAPPFVRSPQLPPRRQHVSSSLAPSHDLSMSNSSFELGLPLFHCPCPLVLRQSRGLGYRVHLASLAYLQLCVHVPPPHLMPSYMGLHNVCASDHTSRIESGTESKLFNNIPPHTLHANACMALCSSSLLVHAHTCICACEHARTHAHLRAFLHTCIE